MLDLPNLTILGSPGLGGGGRQRGRAAQKTDRPSNPRARRHDRERRRDDGDPPGPADGQGGSLSRSRCCGKVHEFEADVHHVHELRGLEMTAPVRPDPEYVFGSSEAELRRLIDQARYFGDLTERLFRRAGRRPGMRVLDVGCGDGDVSLLASALVGPSGRNRAGPFFSKLRQPPRGGKPSRSVAAWRGDPPPADRSGPPWPRPSPRKHRPKAGNEGGDPDPAGRCPRPREAARRPGPQWQSRRQAKGSQGVGNLGGREDRAAGAVTLDDRACLPSGRLGMNVPYRCSSRILRFDAASAWTTCA